MNFDLYIICPILLALQLMITLIDSIAQCNIVMSGTSWFCLKMCQVQ